jgi:hypothetical protein
MIRFLRGLGLVLLGAGALSVPAGAQIATDQPAASPVCARFEAQLANVNRGSADPGRADLIRHAEDAVARQQADLDRTVAQLRRLGCEGISGFFALFTGQSPQCTPLSSQVQQMRGNLDRMMSDLERLKSGSSDQEAQRRALIGQLAQNNCGEQYRTAAAAAGPAGFFDALFGGNVISPGGDGAPSGTFRTVCVRTCDGFYFPVSYSTAQNRFTDDQRSRALQLSQSGRGHQPSRLGRQRPSLHRAAERVPVSARSHAGLLVPPAGPDLGRRTQERRRRDHVRERRHRRDRPESQSALASAAGKTGQGRRNADRREGQPRDADCERP